MPQPSQPYDNTLMIASRPTRAVPVPAVVAALADGRSLQPVWQNELGGVTFEVGGGPDRVFIKWAPATSGIDFRPEIARLEWAGLFAAVPRVLTHGADRLGSWLVTAGLPGETAVAQRWVAEPARAVRAIGRGLRALHDVLPVNECPFSWSVESRMADVQRRLAAGELHPSRWHPDHRGLSLQEALDLLAQPPPIDKLVVCHGDTCAPNTLMTDDGNWSGHVDLGALGVADRWADLAVATWSTVWNYGPGWEDQLLQAYGVERDPWRIAYYRLLWDLGP